MFVRDIAKGKIDSPSFKVADIEGEVRSAFFFNSLHAVKEFLFELFTAENLQ